jgi:hypothetical protein
VLVKQLVDVLREIHGEFRFWASLGKTQFEPLSADLDDLQQHLSVMASPDEDNEGNYTHLDAAGGVTALTTTTGWFNYNLFTSERGYAGGIDFARPDIAELRITLGANKMSSLALTLPDGRPDLVNGDVVTRIVSAIIDLCNPTSLRVYSPAFDEARQQGRQLKHVLDASWMLYIHAPLLAKCLPDTLPCKLERWPDGHLMFRLTDEPP